jgi:hypothetical protein
MNKIDIEQEVIRMGDIGVAIDMVDAKLSEGKAEQAERAVIILKELFDSRYISLRRRLYGGECDA